MLPRPFRGGILWGGGQALKRAREHYWAGNQLGVVTWESQLLGESWGAKRQVAGGGGGGRARSRQAGQSVCRSQHCCGRDGVVGVVGVGGLQATCY